MLAGIAARDVTAEACGSATLDGGHDSG